MDRHPDENELVALALGALPGPEDELLRHLTDCPACHSAYDDVATGVDAVLLQRRPSRLLPVSRHRSSTA
ncbi:hypothetical protein E4K10_40050 [Streptomyces sp. T1317-0309]|nr:hypothetical protein E4K10_40050 [Streptomyces sp. T1317-0309]